jgi:hypothetical protein
MEAPNLAGLSALRNARIIHQDVKLAEVRLDAACAQMRVLMQQGTGLCKNQRENQQQPEHPGVL